MHCRKQRPADQPEAGCLVIHAVSHPIKYSLSINSHRAYRTNVSQNILFGATLAGHLHYRGEIIENVRNGLGLMKWSDDALLAYFTSGVDMKCNFSKACEQTRSGLADILVKRASEGSINSVEELYLKACLEYKMHAGALFFPLWRIRWKVL